MVCTVESQLESSVDEIDDHPMKKVTSPEGAREYEQLESSWSGPHDPHIIDKITGRNQQVYIYIYLYTIIKN